MYLPSLVSTLIFSPLLMKGGTCTVMPVSIFAGLKLLVAVEFLMPGSVSMTVSTTEGGSFDADRPAVVEVDLHVGVGQQVAGLAFEEVGVELHLLVVFLVHEDVAVAVLVEVLHLARIDERALDLVLGAEALVGLGALVDVLHLDLHERAAAPADVHVVALQHAPDPLVPLEELAGPDLDCFDFCHGTAARRRARILHVL